MNGWPPQQNVGTERRIRIMEVTQSEQQKEKRLKNEKEQSGNYGTSNKSLTFMSVESCKKRKKVGLKKVLEKIMTLQVSQMI